MLPIVTAIASAMRIITITKMFLLVLHFNAIPIVAGMVFTRVEVALCVGLDFRAPCQLAANITICAVQSHFARAPQICQKCLSPESQVLQQHWQGSENLHFCVDV